MKPISEIEAERVALQQSCDAEKTQRERNRLGQFATRPQLALEIVRFGKRLLPAQERLRFLDPAFGTGSFFSALLQAFNPECVEKSVGFEIDPLYADRARRLWSGSKLELHTVDFTKAVPPREHDRFNLIVCNPPYVRHHHLTAAEKARLYRLTRSTSGTSLSGLTGLYCYFLLLSDAWADDGGVCLWLIPGEFMDVNYGVSLKEYLLSRVTLLQIHRFAPEDVQFADALVSSAVVCFRKALPPKSHSVKFSFGGALDNPKKSQVILLSNLRANSKWNGQNAHEARENVPSARLSDIFDVKRGLATGHNRFFILSAEEARLHGLPTRFLKPILPSPRYLTADEIESDSIGNPVLDRRLFLLDCALPEHEVKRNYPKLAKYLESGKRDVASGYLCRSRSPWYSQESRPAPVLLCTYMGRSRTENRAPFRFILNHSKATAANVYLLLYPKAELGQALKEKPELTRTIWTWLNGLSPKVVLGEGRVYGGGLHKLEPRELGNIPADGLARLLGISFKKRSHQLDFFGNRDDLASLHP
jgi:adenine-specific DNA-methyltransferase